MIAEATDSQGRETMSEAKKGRRTLIVVIVLAVVLAAMLLVAFVGFGIRFPPRFVRVEGVAMAPTLNHGDRLLMTDRIEPLQRGDIVVFWYPKDTSKTFLKRIIGLPGDRLELDSDGALLINGVVQAEPYIEPNRNLDALLRWSMAHAQDPVPANCYFVMGDNRDFSNDSRSWGPVRRDLIWGKYVMRYWSAE
jgi:signal peptidase I